MKLCVFDKRKVVIIPYFRQKSEKNRQKYSVFLAFRQMQASIFAQRSDGVFKIDSKCQPSKNQPSKEMCRLKKTAQIPSSTIVFWSEGH